MIRKFRLIPILISCLAFGIGTVAHTAMARADDDPPSRVARLSYVRGDVSFVPAGENDWVEAVVNRPLIAGDRLWTDRGGRAELQIGPAALRLDQESNFNFLNLDDNTVQIELTQGTLNLRIRRLLDGQVYEVDTPTLAFTATRSGEYRIDVARGEATTVTVFSGSGEAYGEAGARFRIEEDESVSFHDAGLRDYETADLPRPDDFDNFCFARDDREDHSRSRRYVSEEVVGYSDLDEYGSWSDVAEYGHVWYPSHVNANWAPYREGHWAWVEPWGWTWVDEAPWGFAPFHYGRWAYISNRWGWIPGPIAVRPVYAPALVAFVGGRNFSVGVNVGAPVGWFPLGPREVYVPGYRVSRNYFNNVNVSNTTVNNTYITNVYNNYSRGTINVNQTTYVNRSAPNAMTAVPVSVFTSARPVAAAAVPVDRAMASRAEITAVAAIAPTRASLVSTSAARAVPSSQTMNRTVVARTAPAPTIAPFAARQSTLQQNAGRPLSAATMQQLQTRSAAETPSQVRVVTPTSGTANTADRAPQLQSSGRNPSSMQSNQSTAATNARTIEPRGQNNRIESDRGREARSNTIDSRTNNAPPSAAYRQSESTNAQRTERRDLAAPNRNAQSQSPVSSGNEMERERRVDTPVSRIPPQQQTPSNARYRHETQERGSRIDSPQTQTTTPRENSESQPPRERNTYMPPIRSAQPEVQQSAPQSRNNFERQATPPPSVQTVQRPQPVERAAPQPVQSAPPPSIQVERGAAPQAREQQPRSPEQQSRREEHKREEQDRQR